MADVSRILVKLFFEMNGFLVQEDDYLFVVNRSPAERRVKPGFILQSDNVALVPGAIVSVRAWHSSVFSPSRVNREPHLYDLLGEESLKNAVSFFGERKFKKVLVLSRLPRTEETRGESVRLLRAEGLDHVVEFSSVLAYLAREVESGTHYAHSDVLQLVRLLKAYGFLREPQMELFEKESA